MKTIYFVRHGSTEQLEKRVWQDPGVPLSKKGQEQARFVAQRFASIPINVIISSEMQRALDTAHAIAEVTRMEVAPSPLFHELLRPSEIRGKSKDDPKSSALFEELDRRFRQDSTEKYSDEESFFDLRSRAAEAVQFLENHQAKNICVVTHGTFLKTMMAVMMGGSEVPHQAAGMIYDFFFPSNTGITKCTFGETGWWLQTWNDDAHMGEIKDY